MIQLKEVAVKVGDSEHVDCSSAAKVGEPRFLDRVQNRVLLRLSVVLVVGGLLALFAEHKNSLANQSESAEITQAQIDQERWFIEHFVSYKSTREYDWVQVQNTG